jgi:putative phage-type endonuclease
METLFDAELKHITKLRAHIKRIVRDTPGLTFNKFFRSVMTAMDGDLGKVWQRRRLIKRVLDKYGLNDQRTQQWHNTRSNMVTASEVTKAFASASPMARYEIMIKKVLGPKAPSTQEGAPKALIWGTQFEPVAKRLFEQFEGIQIVDTSCVKHPKHPFLGASPDGIILTPNPMDPRWGKLVEFKCPISRQFKEDSPVPDYYWHQMQMQMECTGVDECIYLEFRFESLPYPKWQEHPAHIKGAFICFDDGEVVYKPEDVDYMPWLRKSILPKSDEYKATFWILAQWRKVTVKRDYTWMPTHLDELTSFWQEVLKHREAGTVPENPSPPNRFTLDISGDQNIDLPDVSLELPTECPPILTG